MNATVIVSVLACLLALTISGQTDSAQTSSEEDKAFAAMTALMSKTKQGGEHPTEQDLKTRREAGIELAKTARQFSRKYPESKKTEDAQALVNVGLYEASLAGDAAAAKELEHAAADALKNAEMPEMLKLYTFVINYVAQWAKKEGRHTLDQGSADFLKAYMEGLFAAVDLLSDKESIFKMLLLQAKSGTELTMLEKKSIAERVLNHSGASAVIKAEAQKILSGEQPYAVGKPLDINFTAVDGTSVDLKTMKGKVVLVDFWATWCGPCVAEVPTLKSTYATYHAKGFEIIGISLDEDKTKLLEFTKEKGVTWPQYFDGKHWNNEISFHFGINSVPTEWLVDKKGILREVNTRFHLEQSVEQLLNEH